MEAIEEAGINFLRARHKGETFRLDGTGKVISSKNGNKWISELQKNR